MKKILITAVALALAVPALAAQQDIAQLSAVTASREALRTAINTQLSAVQSNFDEIYPILTAGPVYANTTAPADTKVVWIDTDQDSAIKVYVGGAWTVVGSGGSYTLPTAAADTLGGVKVGSRLTITDGVLSADVQTTDISGKEDLLGNPSTNGYVLSSTTLGVRSWIEMTGGGAGIAHATSDGNYYASKDGGWASLAGVFLNPSGSADLLTITDTGSYFTTDTVGAALQELGGAPELLFGAEFTEMAGTGTVTLTLDFPVTSEVYGAGWATDTEGAQRDDIYAILHVGDTDDDGMADKLDLDSAGFVKVNASGVVSSVKEKEYIGWSVVNSDTAITEADGKMGAAIPAGMVGMAGMNLVDFTCSVADLNSAASGATTVVLRRVRGGTAADMTSTGVTIDYNEYTASDEVIDTSNDDLATGDNLYVDINAVTTAAQKGLHCTATFEAP